MRIEVLFSYLSQLTYLLLPGICWRWYQISTSSPTVLLYPRLGKSILTFYETIPPPFVFISVAFLCPRYLTVLPPSKPYGGAL